MSTFTPGLPRRRFVGSLAAGAATLVAAKWSTAGAEVVAGATAPNDDWVARITGKYKQVFDCTTANGGFGAAYPLNFIESTKEAAKVGNKDVSAVVVYRHFSMPLMLNDAMWAKYKIGALLDIKDPKTNAAATRNVFRDNVPLYPGLTFEQEMSERGVIFTACNMALTVLSGMSANNAGVSGDVAKKEWTANLLAGVYLAPSGVYAVNRAQQAGCSYCYGG